MAVKRPVLRYHGGKWMLAPWILSLFPPHRVYVEPFGGAGSVLMRKHPAFAEVYNDLDGDIVNVFRVLRDPNDAAELKRLLELTPLARDEFVGSYEPSPDPVEQARRTVVRAFMAFGSTSRRKNPTGFRSKCYRYNQTGIQDWINWPKHIASFTERLRKVCIENRPAIELIPQQDSESTLFYIDPPYPTSTRSSIRKPSENDRAYAHDLTDQDHRNLAAVIRKTNGMVVISTYPSDLYEELYPDWVRLTQKGFSDRQRPREEVVYMNPSCAARLEQSRGLFGGFANVDSNSTRAEG